MQIRKYLQGELDAKAMHQLERRAQDDPFLMDAMEGYGSAAGDQQANLKELSDRLAQRTTETRRKIVPLWMISAAASVLIICSVGIWWFNKNNDTATPPAKQVAANEVKPATPAVTTSPRVSSPDTTRRIASARTGTPNTRKTAAATITDNSKPEANAPALAEVGVVQPVVAAKPDVTAYKDTTALGKMIARQYAASTAVDTSLFVRKAPLLKNANTDAPLQLLPANVQGLTQQIPPRGDLNKAVSQGYISGPMADRLLANRDLDNRVFGKNSIPTNAGYSSNNADILKASPNNAAELFKRKADSVSKKMGLLSSQYKAMPASTAVAADTTKNAAPAAGTDLSEEVVIGYTSQKKDVNDADAIAAHPQKGWSNFKKYLKANAVSPDNKEGVVKLSFMVDRFGSLTAIKVTAGLSDAADKKAISLVKDGPEWTGNSNKQPEKVHLRIRFIKRG